MDTYPPNTSPPICPKCGLPLDIDGLDPSVDIITGLGGRAGVFKYLDPGIFSKYVSLGEGDTPIIYNGDLKLYFKLDYLNPSGSFKDRGSASAVSIAYMFGFKDVVEDSSGNAGASISLYSSSIGIKPHIFIPRDAPSGKASLIRLLGGIIHYSNDRAEAYNDALGYSRKNSYYYIGHVINPYFNTGLRSIAYEVFNHNLKPDNIIVPVGSGGLFLGLYNGFKDIHLNGLIDEMPRIHAVEVAGYERISRMVSGVTIYVDKVSKLADGLRVEGPPRILEIRDALDKCGGGVIVVDDEEIREALKILLSRGYIIEPTSAVAYAGYLKGLEYNIIDKGIDLIILTGSGFKMIDMLLELIK